METILGIIANSDFAILWEIGRQVLLGNSPYAIGNSWYPPAASYLFALFALVPFEIAYIGWLFVNLSLLYIISRKYGLRWISFLPVIFVLIAGQVDLILVALIPFLSLKGWRPAIAAAIITLKPISAFVILPWFLIRWLAKDRSSFGKFLFATSAVHIWPLFIRPSVIFDWIVTIFRSGTGHYYGGIGVWLLGSIPAWLLVLVSLSLAIFALLTHLPEKSRTLLALANPYAMFYHTVYLVGESSLSTIAMANAGIIIALILKSPIPLILVPLSFLVKDNYDKQKTALLLGYVDLG